MKKKIILSGVALVAICLGIVGMSAFEAHVVNVTAKIENAMVVPQELNGLSFGPVFPEEVAYKNLDIQLSQSFLDEPRVDDVEYMIRQKPKCGVPNPAVPGAYLNFPQVTDGPNGTYVCPPDSIELPLLCPYLSKHELDQAGAPLPGGIDAFHGPLTNWTLTDTINSQVLGRLSKAEGNNSDTWQIDLHAPCFKGECAQDNVILPAYQADIANKGKLYGCDLWLEVTNISPSKDKATLIVIKHVDNTGGGTATANQFTMNIDGISAVPSSFPGAEAPGTNVIVVPPGSYIVTESGPSGYTQSASADCTGTIAKDEIKTCTITNKFILPEPKLTVTKTLIPNTDPGKFNLQIDNSTHATDVGDGGTTGAITVAEGAHGVSEIAGTNTNLDDYITEIGGDCTSGGSVTVVAGESKTCTIKNTLKGGTLKVIKVVDNKDGLGTAIPSDFTINVSNGTPASFSGAAGPSGTDVSIPGNISYSVTEDVNSAYDTVLTGDCSGTMPPNGSKTCTVTNTFKSGAITVNKIVVNSFGGLKVAENFSLLVVGPSGFIGVSNGVPKNFAVPVSYDITETGPDGYEAKFSGDCGTSGHIDLVAGDNKTCTITNQDIAPRIKLVKIVIGTPAEFTLRIDGTVVPNGFSYVTTSNANHTITEDAKTGYQFTSMTGTGSQGTPCPTSLGGTVNLKEGETITCTITNTQNL